MKRSFLIAITIIFLLPTLSFAKGAGQFIDAVTGVYQPAVKSRALQTGAVDLDLKTVNSFVVLNESGIPAERAEHFVGWGNYDYRGTDVDLETGKIAIRIGPVYTYLNKSEILAVADVFTLGKKIYIGLITPEPYIPTDRKKQKRHSRVTLTLMFKVPEAVRESGDTAKVLELLKAWVIPFKTLDDAKNYVAAQSQPQPVQKTKKKK